jgi:type 1 glutamine amidotransferase
MDKISLAILTGGHAFDVPNFHHLFRRMEGINAYIQTVEDFAGSPQATRDAYHVVLFYHMLPESPAQKAQAAFDHLRDSGQGLVVLHHALLAYPQWPTWREISGIDPAFSAYHHDQHVDLTVTRSGHPIFAGLDEFSLTDETYVMNEPDAGNDILLVTNHPKSVHAQAWTRTWQRSRVFSWTAGHDHQAWADPNFEMILRRAIFWTSGSL